MKKTALISIMWCFAALSLTGCGKKGITNRLDDYSQYVTLCEYKGVPANQIEYEVTNEEIQERINQDMYGYVSYQPITDRGATEGDYINVDYKGTVDGVELAEHSGTGVDYLLGEHILYKEAEKEIQGMMAGDVKTMDIILTSEYAESPDDVGKLLNLTVTLNEISVEQLPEYSDAFVSENLGYESVDEYEDAIVAELEKKEAKRCRDLTADEIIEYIKDNSVFDVYPSRIYDEGKKKYDIDLHIQASEWGVSDEEYLQMIAIDENDMESDIIDEVNTMLVVKAIAQKEKIDCTQEDVDSFSVDHYMDYGFGSQQEFLDSYGQSLVMYEAIYQKVIDFLIENAELTTIPDVMETFDEDDDEQLPEPISDETELVDTPVLPDDEDGEEVVDVQASDTDDSDSVINVEPESVQE